jgi:hypothetical protein
MTTRSAKYPGLRKPRSSIPNMRAGVSENASAILVSGIPSSLATVRRTGSEN